MQVLALDFDGVISDSAPEAFVVALRSYVGMRKSSRFALDLERLQGSGPPDRDRIAKDRLYRDFLELMPLGNRAEDYAVELAVLECGIAIPDQEAYDEQRNTQPQAFLDAFHERFYEERRRFSERDPEGWRRLLAPYPPLVDLLRRRAGEVELAIATAKDRRSVGLLLSDYQLDDLFPEDRILDKETGRDKRTHLAKLQQRLKVPFPEITFVDDKVNHLESVSSMGVRCALAAWGYNGDREREIARRRKYVVCGLDHFESRIFG